MDYMGNYRIRRAVPGDERIMGCIHTRSWKEAYKDIIPQRILDNLNLEKRIESFKKALREGKEIYGVVLVDDQLVGLICIGECRDDDLDEHHGEIWGIYILPEYWSRGMGRELTAWGLEEMKKLGYTKAALWVLAENRRARTFYEKSGFHFDGAIKEITLGKTLEECRYIKVL